MPVLFLPLQGETLRYRTRRGSWGLVFSGEVDDQTMAPGGWEGDGFNGRGGEVWREWTQTLYFSSWAFWTGLHFLDGGQWKGVVEPVSLVSWKMKK